MIYLLARLSYLNEKINLVFMIFSILIVQPLRVDLHQIAIGELISTARTVVYGFFSGEIKMHGDRDAVHQTMGACTLNGIAHKTSFDSKRKKWVILRLESPTRDYFTPAGNFRISPPASWIALTILLNSFRFQKRHS